MEFLRRLFGRVVDARPAASDARAAIDLNKPVENPALVSAMNAFAKSRTAATESELTLRLRGAVFLVPTVTDEVRMTPGETPGKVTFKTGSLIKIPICQDDDGGSHLPLFTDWDAIRSWTGEPVSAFVMPAAEAWGFALSQYAGAVVNPGKGGLPLSKSLIEYIRSGTMDPT